MDFKLPARTVEIQRIARTFAEEVVAPHAARLDREEQFDISLWKEAAARGLGRITIPQAYDGLGLGNLELSVMLEEVNRVCASTGVTLSVHASLACAPIIANGTEAQKQAWLPRMAIGELLGCYSLTEPVSGSDAAGLICKAEREGEDYVINGTKSWITSAPYADVMILMARTGPHKTRGITSFIVPMDTPGLTVAKAEQKSGLRGSKTCEVILENARVPAANVLAEEGMGFKIAMSMLDGGRIGIASQSLGIGQAAFDVAVAHLRQLAETGVELDGFGGVHEQLLADMSVRLEGARLLTRRAAVMRDNGEPVSLAASQAKLAASRAANFIADQAMQLLGEAAYTTASAVERHFRDARITEIYEGTSEIQRLVIARNTLRGA